MHNILISVGGSIIYPPAGINIAFLKDFNEFIRKKIAENKNRRFFIMAGGGFVSREYKEAAEKINNSISNHDLDWLGVRATRLNAHLLRSIFWDVAEPRIVEHYDRKPEVDSYQVVICAGWHPGSSTDWALILLAKNLNEQNIYSLVNVDRVYDKNPKKNPDAKPLRSLTWTEYRRLIEPKWNPKIETPFDPVAATLAQELGVRAILVGGKDLKNFEKALQGKDFIGTTLSFDETIREEL